VDPDDGVEVVVAHLPQHGVAQHARVRDQDVETPELLERGVDQALGGLGRTDRCDDGDGFAPGRFDRGDGVRGDLLIDVVDEPVTMATLPSSDMDDSFVSLRPIRDPTVEIVNY
jgi:hypothetical protein